MYIYSTEMKEREWGKKREGGREGGREEREKRETKVKRECGQRAEYYTMSQVPSGLVQDFMTSSEAM